MSVRIMKCLILILLFCPIFNCDLQYGTVNEYLNKLTESCSCTLVSVNQPSGVDLYVAMVKMKTFHQLERHMNELPVSKTFVIVLWSWHMIQNQTGSIERILEKAKFRAKLQLYILDDQVLDLQHEPTGALIERFSDVIFLTSDERGILLIYEHCKTTKKLRLFEAWEDDKMITRTARACSPESLQGQHVQVSVLGIYPYVQYTQTGITGSDLSIVAILADKMGFTFSLKPERAWRRQIGNTSQWIGTFGSVMNSDSLFGIGNIILSNAGNIPVNFCHGLYPIDANMLAPKPKPLHPILNFLRPFSAPVWIGLVVIQILGVLMFKIIFSTNDRFGSFRATANSTWSAIAMTITTLTNKTNAMKLPQSMWFRVYLISWSLATFFMIMAYLSNYRAYMVKIDYEKPIETEEDLVENDIDLFFPRGTELFTMYETSTISIRREIFKRSMASRTAFSVGPTGLADDETYQRICKETSAILTFAMGSQKTKKDFISTCDTSYFRVTKETLFSFHGTIITPKNRDWQEKADGILLRLVETGIIEHLIDSFNDFPLQVQPESYPTNAMEPLRIIHIAGVLMILASGLLISFVAFSMERFHVVCAKIY